MQGLRIASIILGRSHAWTQNPIEVTLKDMDQCLRKQTPPPPKYNNALSILLIAVSWIVLGQSHAWAQNPIEVTLKAMD